MTKEQVIQLMTSSVDATQWSANCLTVKKSCNGYPDFWFEEIILSGLMERALEPGSSEIRISVL